MLVVASSTNTCPPLRGPIKSSVAAAQDSPLLVTQTLTSADKFRQNLTLHGAAAGSPFGGMLGMMTALTGADAVGMGRIPSQYVLIKALSFGMVAGAVSGAIAANLTTDRPKAAGYGALVGAGVGFAIGLPAGLKSAVVWSAWGAGSALAGAVAGSSVALRAAEAGPTKSP